MTQLRRPVYRPAARQEARRLMRNAKREKINLGWFTKISLYKWREGTDRSDTPCGREPATICRGSGRSGNSRASRSESSSGRVACTLCGGGLLARPEQWDWAAHESQESRV